MQFALSGEIYPHPLIFTNKALLKSPTIDFISIIKQMINYLIKMKKSTSKKILTQQKIEKLPSLAVTPKVIISKAPFEFRTAAKTNELSSQLKITQKFIGKLPSIKTNQAKLTIPTDNILITPSSSMNHSIFSNNHSIASPDSLLKQYNLGIQENDYQQPIQQEYLSASSPKIRMQIKSTKNKDPAKSFFYNEYFAVSNKEDHFKGLIHKNPNLNVQSKQQIYGLIKREQKQSLSHNSELSLSILKSKSSIFVNSHRGTVDYNQQSEITKPAHRISQKVGSQRQIDLMRQASLVKNQSELNIVSDQIRKFLSPKPGKWLVRPNLIKSPRISDSNSIQLQSMRQSPQKRQQNHKNQIESQKSSSKSDDESVSDSNSNSIRSKTHDSEEHDIWDNQEIENRGLDIDQISQMHRTEQQKNIINFHNVLRFLLMYKIRYGTFPTQREQISNDQVVQQVCDMTQNNKKLHLKYFGNPQKIVLKDQNDYSKPVELNNDINFLSYKEFITSSNVRQRNATIPKSGKRVEDAVNIQKIEPKQQFNQSISEHCESLFTSRSFQDPNMQK